MAEVRYRVAATEGGTALLSGSVGVTGGTWSQALTIPSGIADGAAWWLGRSGLDDAGNAETWKWTQHFIAAVQTVSAFPQALGTLSAQPTWLAGFQSMFGAAHNPVTTQGTASWPAPTRTVQFDTLPILDDSTLKVTSTGMTDFEKRWMGYFGNHTGYSGTRQAGDRLVLTEDATYVTAARNLDIPRFTDLVEIYAPGVTIQHTHADASTGLMSNHAIRLLGDRQSLPTDGSVTDEQAQANSARRIYIHGSKAKPAKLETIGAVGRTGLNQQGNTMLLVDPFCHDIIVEDVHGIGARAAGFFGYKGRRVWFNRCESIETWADAFHAANGCQDFLYTDCTSRRSGDDGIAPVRYSGEADTSSSVRIAYIRHRVIGTGHGRGTVSICNSDIYWDQCYIEGSAAGGFLWDREEGASSNPKGMANNLAQRMHVKGCNWSEQDHGSIFLNNGAGGVTVSGRIESMLIEDAMPNRQVVRSIGTGPLQIVAKDFKAVGGPGNATWWGGNNTGVNGVGNAASYTTFDPAALRQETAGADTTPPTVVWLAPGRKATITGTLTGRPQKTSNSVLVDDLGNTGAYRNTMLAFYAGHVLGLTSTGVEVRLGDTVLGTVAKSALDSAGRGYLEGVDTTRFRNGAGYLSIRATSSSGKTSTVVYRPITVSNASPGTLAIVPSAYTGVDRVTTAA